MPQRRGGFSRNAGIRSTGDGQTRPVEESSALPQGIALPLLGIWCWRIFGDHETVAAALWTGDESLALALCTNLARPNDDPGVVPGVSGALACQACHLFLASATRTLLLDFTHSNPSLRPESLANRCFLCPVNCLSRQIIRDPGAWYYPGCYLTARIRVKSRAPFGCIMAPTGLNMFPSKLANRS